MALVLLVLLAWSPVPWAAPPPVEGCVDQAGRPVQVVEDGALPVLARAQTESGRRLLRVNRDVMAGLSHRARTFFVAYACARHALALGTAPLSAAQARRADCWALAALKGSGALDAADSVAQLQAELMLGDEAQWRLLPGPAREVDLSGCGGAGALRLPLAAEPARGASNRCVHACGDRLWQCQKRCAGGVCRGGCESIYDVCVARCPPP